MTASLKIIRDFCFNSVFNLHFIISYVSMKLVYLIVYIAHCLKYSEYDEMLKSC